MPTPRPTTSTLVVLEPNENTIWAMGQTRIIKWRYSSTLAGTTGAVTLRLYLDGNLAETIGVLVSASANQFDWTIASSLGSHDDTYTLRVQNAAVGIDVYSELFCIAASLSPTLLCSSSHH